MPRGGARRVSTRDDASPPAAADAAEMHDTDEEEVAAAPSSAVADRRAQAAEIARSRAAFFAMGGGAGSGVADPVAARGRGRGRGRGGAARSSARAEGDDDDAEMPAASKASSGSAGASAGSHDAEGRRFEGWVGPFATARHLLEQRDAAARQREDAGAGAGSPLARTAASSSADDTGLRSEDLAVISCARCHGIEHAHYSPAWRPNAALIAAGAAAQRPVAPGAASASAAASAAAAASLSVSPSSSPVRAASSSSSAEPEPEPAASPTTSASAAASTSTSASFASFRRALAVAGPSGVRTTVPSLASLCLIALTPYLNEIDDLQGLPVPLQRAFAEATCRDRLMDNHAFKLFAAAAAGAGAAGDAGPSASSSSSSGGASGLDGDAVWIPDASGVDEKGMCEGLCVATGHPPDAYHHHHHHHHDHHQSHNGKKDEDADMADAQAGGGSNNLTSLWLRHCGRGFTARAVTVLSPLGVFTQLRSLTVLGAYTLTDAAVDTLLAHTPHLLHLHIGASPLLKGSFVSVLPSRVPQLRSLKLEALPELSDAHLRGAVAILPPVAAKQAGGAGDDDGDRSSNVKRRKMHHGGDHVDAGDGEGEGEEEQGSGSAAAAAPSSSKKRASASTSSVVTGGILALDQLTGFGLVHTPLVTDAVVGVLLQRRGAALTALALSHVPLLTDATCTVIAEHCGSGGLSRLRFDTLPRITHYGLSALATALPHNSLQSLSMCRLHAVKSAIPLLVLLATQSASLQSVALCGLPTAALHDGCLGALTHGLHPPRPSSAADTDTAADAGADAGSGGAQPRVPRRVNSRLTSCDISMSRGPSDAGVGLLLDSCPSLSRLVVFGCAQLTGACYGGHGRAVRGLDPAAVAASPQLRATETQISDWAALRVYGRQGDPMPAPELGDTAAAAAEW